MSEFTEKVIAIQSKLKAPKGQYNSFGKYRYRSCEDILEAVKPLLSENGLRLTLSDDIAPIGERYYVRATATLSDGENSIECRAFAREDKEKKGMDGSQITGTASSYARKYALNGLFLIDDTKDADTDEHAKQSKQKQPKQEKQEEPQDYMQPVREWWRAFEPLFETREEALGNLLRNIGARDMKSLTPEQAEKAVAHMAKVYAERNAG